MRDLTEDERRMYEKNLEKQREDLENAMVLLEYEKLMYEKVNEHNFKIKQKQSRLQIEECQARIDIANGAIEDCEKKLKGVD